KLDNTLAEAHASLAGVLFRYDWNWAEAEQEFDLAVKIDPDYAEGHRARAIFLMVLRRYDEAVDAAQRARDLDPFSPVINVDLGMVLMTRGRPDKAPAQLDRTKEIAPDLPRLHRTQAVTYFMMGNRRRALEILEHSPAAFAGPMWLGYLPPIPGRNREARKVLRD